MQVSRRELLACVTGLAGMSSTLGAGTLAHFTDTATASGTLQAGTWVSNTEVVYFSSDLKTIQHQSDPASYSVPDTIWAGPGTTTFGGEYKIPYVANPSSNPVELGLASDTGTQVLNTDGIPPRTNKTILATGSWNGSGSTIFYASASDASPSNALYRISPADSSPTLISDLGNSAKGVLGPIDIDGDGTVELVYVDGSAQARYLKPGDESGTKIGGFGENNGYGVGAPFQAPSGPRIPFVNGSNAVALMWRESGTTYTKPITAGSTAKKAPLAAADIDGDGEFEIVFIGSSNSEIKYVDDLDPETAANNDEKTVTDSTGSALTVGRTKLGVL